jgi:hypothetical protein
MSNEDQFEDFLQSGSNSMPSVDSNYESEFLEKEKNFDEYTLKQNLINDIYNYLIDSKWGEYIVTSTSDLNHEETNENTPRLKSNKINQSYMGEVYSEVVNQFSNTFHSKIDIFDSITKIFDISYEKLYEYIHVNEKENLIKELDEKYGVLSKKKIRSLF